MALNGPSMSHLVARHGTERGLGLGSPPTRQGFRPTATLRETRPYLLCEQSQTGMGRQGARGGALGPDGIFIFIFIIFVVVVVVVIIIVIIIIIIIVVLIVQVSGQVEVRVKKAKEGLLDEALF